MRKKGEGGRVRKERRQNFKSVNCCCFVEVSLSFGFEGVGGLNVTNVRREIIPLLMSRVRERALAEGFSFNMGDAKCPRVCGRTKLSGRCVHSEKVREVGRG